MTATKNNAEDEIIDETYSTCHPEDACPKCGERNTDHLIWQDDGTILCTVCHTRYNPDH